MAANAVGSVLRSCSQGTIRQPVQSSHHAHANNHKRASARAQSSKLCSSNVTSTSSKQGPMASIVSLSRPNSRRDVRVDASSDAALGDYLGDISGTFFPHSVQKTLLKSQNAYHPTFATHACDVAKISTRD